MSIIKNDVIYFYNGSCWLRIKTDSDWCQTMLKAFSAFKNTNSVATNTLAQLYKILSLRAPDTFNLNNVTPTDFSENVVTIDFTTLEYYREGYPWRKLNFSMSQDCSRGDIVLSFDYNQLF